MGRGNNLVNKVQQVFPTQAVKKSVVPAKKNHVHSEYAPKDHTHPIPTSQTQVNPELETQMNAKMKTLLTEAIEEFQRKNPPQKVITHWEFEVVRLSNNLTYKIIANGR